MQNVHLGPVHLTVADLARSVAFYSEAIGLRVLDQDEPGRSTLGTDHRALLVLHEDAQARPAGRHAGLYHVAYLFEGREELAHAVLRLAATRTRIDGASDHGVSEAVYLSDPDGNGIELYADRSRETWPAPQGPDERVGMFSAPLDLDALLGLVEGQAPAPHAAGGLSVGHLHLHVGDLPQALAFYRDALGLDLMTEYPGAAFLAADGYHHHLGVNVWRGEGVPGPPDHVAGLRRWTLRTEDLDAVRDRLAAAGVATEDGSSGSIVVRDPWGIELELTGVQASSASSSSPSQGSSLSTSGI